MIKKLFHFIKSLFNSDRNNEEKVTIYMHIKTEEDARKAAEFINYLQDLEDENLEQLEDNDN